MIYTKVGDVDTLNEKFNAQATIEMRWKDPTMMEDCVTVFKFLIFN